MCAYVVSSLSARFQGAFPGTDFPSIDIEDWARGTRLSIGSKLRQRPEFWLRSRPASNSRSPIFVPYRAGSKGGEGPLNFETARQVSTRALQVTDIDALRRRLVRRPRHSGPLSRQSGHDLGRWPDWVYLTLHSALFSSSQFSQDVSAMSTGPTPSHDHGAIRGRTLKREI